MNNKRNSNNLFLNLSKVSDKKKILKDALVKYQDEKDFKNYYIDLLLNKNLVEYLGNKIVIIEHDNDLLFEFDNISGIKTLNEFLCLKKMFLSAFDFLENKRNCINNIPPILFFEKGEDIFKIYTENKNLSSELLINIEEKINTDPSVITSFKTNSSITFTAKQPGYLVIRNKMFSLYDPIVFLSNSEIVKAAIVNYNNNNDRVINYIEKWIKNFKTKHPDAPVQLTYHNDYEVNSKNHLTFSNIIVGKKVKIGKDAFVDLNIQYKNIDNIANHVNLKEIKNYNVVKNGELLLIKYKKIDGIPGLDIFGNEIGVTETKDVDIKYNDNINMRDLGDHIHYYSNTDGLFFFNNNEADVEEVMVVEGDVCFETGNIEYEKNVIIKGDVLTGFSVKSGMDVIIEGAVENGAQIVCRGDLTVHQGIIGKDTKITCKGNVTAAYILDAAVYCEKGTYITNNVIGGRIFSNDLIKIHGGNIKKSNQSAVYGGEYFSLKKIVVHSAGNENRFTVFSSGINPYLRKMVLDLSSAIAANEIEIAQKIHSIGYNIHLPIFKRIVDKLPTSEKFQMKEKLLLIKKLLEQKDNYCKLKNEYEKNVYAEIDDDPAIIFEKYLFPKIQVKVATQNNKKDNEITHPAKGFFKYSFNTQYIV